MQRSILSYLPTVMALFVIAILTAVALAEPFSHLGGPKRIDWEYVVPDGYRGRLYLYYSCKGGERIPAVGHKAVLRFPRAGVFCASEEFQAYYGSPVARFADGTPLRIAPNCGSKGLIFCGHGAKQDRHVNDGNIYEEFEVRRNE